MTFSESVKRELCGIRYERTCCQTAHLYGMLCFAKEFTRYRTVFTSEYSFLLDHFRDALSWCGFDSCHLAATDYTRGGSLTVSNREANEQLLFEYGYSGTEMNLRLNRDNFYCDECFGAFLAGTFLAGGTMTDPSINYHLEFSTHKSTFLSDFCRLLEEHHFAPKVAERGYSKIVYFKDSSRIEDLLATMGAVERTLELMNTKIVKEIRNSVNRRANCESANIDKTVEAAAADCAAILYLKECGAFETLSDNIRAVADARLENPELSLAELGELFQPALAKSAVNYRLSKIKAMAENLRSDRT